MTLDPKILMIEDDIIISNLIERIFKDENVDFEIVSGGKEALKKLQNNVFRAIIIDYDMENGTTLSFLKRNSIKIPIVAISSQDIDKQVYLKEGASSVIRKPFYGQEIYHTIMNLLELTEVYKGLEESSSIIRALSSALDYRDSYTEGHSIRTLEFATMLYDGTGLSDLDDKHTLRLGCMLHDIGKIGIPDDILKSPNRLTPEERVEIEKHPVVGFEICKNIKNLQDALNIIRWHHEKLDGSGYPDGISGDEIPELVQIVTISDIFDALTTKRTYRKENTVEEALDMLKKEADEGKLNSYFVSFFTRIAKDKLRKRGVL